MFKYITKTKIDFVKVLAIVLLLLVFCMLFVKKGAILSFNNGNLDFFSQKILNLCSLDSYKRSCYDREIPKLLERGLVTMEEAFAITSRVQDVDRSYLYCHVLGHDLADIETRKDTDKWLDVIARCPSLACNNGCAHGAVMRKFKGSEVLSDSQLITILPDLKVACESRAGKVRSELEISMCYHSMGHLGMYITDADVNKSLSICKEIGVKDDGRNYYQTCAQGVFMIIFQSLDDEDVALVSKIKPTKEKLESFCAKYTDIEFVACRTESWPYFSQELKDPKGLINFCSFTEDKYYKEWCYDVGLRGRVNLDILETSGVTGVSKFCLQLPTDVRGRCFPSVATGWVQNEPRFITDSIKLCEIADKFGYSDACYNGLLFFSKFSFNKGSVQWESYCNNFPGTYKERCFSGEVPDGW